MKVIIITIFLLLIIFFSFNYVSQKISPSTTSVLPQANNNGEEIFEFEGKLTKFDDSCKVDATCKAVANEYTIITNPGDVGVPAIGTSDIWTDDVGKTVKVRAKRVNDKNFTLVGDSTLYVKLAE